MASIDTFTQVTFTGIQECYYRLNNLKCDFTVSPLLVPDSNDVVGIFKVGWSSTKDFLCCVTVSVPADVVPNTSLETSVEFAGNLLLVLYFVKSKYSI